MKALIYTGPEQLEYGDVPTPESGEDVQVKVSACGICGSDMHAYLGHDERRPAPLILGHEAVGTAVSGQYEGRRVAINPLVTCGVCDACLAGRSNLCAERQIISMMPRPGAFAEYVTIPERNLVAVPEDLDDEIAALTEPMAVSYHAVNLAERALASPLSAGHVAVIGGGAIGMGAAQIVRSRGCASVTIADTSALKRAAIDRGGMFATYDPQGPGGPAAGTVDLVIDAYGGSRSREAASMLVRPGGVIVHIGLASDRDGLDIRKLTLQEVTFIGTYTYTMVEFRQTLAGLANGVFGACNWVEQRPLSDGAMAFRELNAGSVQSAKIVLRM